MWCRKVQFAVSIGQSWTANSGAHRHLSPAARDGTERQDGCSVCDGGGCWESSTGTRGWATDHHEQRWYVSRSCLLVYITTTQHTRYTIDTPLTLCVMSSVVTATQNSDFVEVDRLTAASCAWLLVFIYIYIYISLFTKAANKNKMLSYRRETALQGALQFSPKVEDSNWETIFYGHYRSIFNHCDIIGLKICRIPWKIAK